MLEVHPIDGCVSATHINTDDINASKGGVLSVVMAENKLLGLAFVASDPYPHGLCGGPMFALSIDDSYALIEALQSALKESHNG